MHDTQAARLPIRGFAHLRILFHGAEMAVKPIEGFFDHFIAVDVVANVIQDAGSADQHGAQPQDGSRKNRR